MENKILIFIKEPSIMSTRNLATGTDWDIKIHKIRVTTQNTTKISTISCLLTFNTILVKDTAIDLCFVRMHNFSTDKIPAWRCKCEQYTFFVNALFTPVCWNFISWKCGWFVTVLQFCLFNYVLFTCLWFFKLFLLDSEISVFDIYFPIAPSHGDSHFVLFRIINSRPIFQSIR